MRIQSRNYISAITIAVVLMFGLAIDGYSQGQRGQQNQPPAGPAPRGPDGKPLLGADPATGKAARWGSITTTLPQGKLDAEPGVTFVGPESTIPFQPWAAAVYAARQIDQFEPHTRCKASGGSRQFSTPYGTEFVDVPELKRLYIMDNGGPNSYRVVYLDGRSHPKDLVPTNYGHSIGWWEGDTLVVETVGFNEKFWLDTRGTPHTKQLRYIEKFTRINERTLNYQVTIDDPGAYTAPWTTEVFDANLNPGAELFEYLCQDNNHGDELMMGSQAVGEVDNTRFYIP
jgi:hypothetical protein